MNNTDWAQRKGSSQCTMNGIVLRSKDSSGEVAGGIAEQMNRAGRLVDVVVKVCEIVFWIAHIFSIKGKLIS